MNDIHVLVINLDNLQFTKDCMIDLMMQMDDRFDLTVIDNGSKEPGTKEYMEMLTKNGIHVNIKPTTIPLCHLWNEFYHTTKNKYLMFLNNDVRLSCNFVRQVVQVFEREPIVGIVVHATNNPAYCEVRDLEYKVLFEKVRQGWDFTIRRECYVPTPPEMEVYFGDDYHYAQVYKKHMMAAMLLSAPMIHFLGQSVKSVKDGQYVHDKRVFDTTGLTRDWPWSGYSNGRPDYPLMTIKNKMAPLLTVGLVTYERHSELLRILRQFQRQTDPRFLVDIWQDGPDSGKRIFVETLGDDRFIYNENPQRQNKYGHDMRHKSIMKCKTPYWCTSNDDNLVSPFFVEKILGEFEQDKCDMVQYPVAMHNLPKKPWDQVASALEYGYTNKELYFEHMKVLEEDAAIEGDVDAASCVVKSELAKKIGWTHMEFHGDFLFFSDLLKQNPIIGRLPLVLQVHN